MSDGSNVGIQGILMTAYRDLDWVLDLIRRFNDGRFAVFVHVDRKTDRVERERFETACATLDCVASVRSDLVVNWGSFNHLKAALLLARQALTHGVDYLHFITGQDYPVKTIDTIVATGATQLNHLQAFSLPSDRTWRADAGGLARVDRFHPFDRFDYRTSRGHAAIKLAQRAQKLLPIRRQLPDLPLYGGSSYWSLTRICVAYLLDYLDEDPRLMRRFEYTLTPEEILPHTVLMNSSFASTIVNDDLRYILWERRHGSRPAILDESDFDDIVASSALFARKFDRGRSAALLRRIDNEIHHQR
jgi:hypothetical protein